MGTRASTRRSAGRLGRAWPALLACAATGVLAWSCSVRDHYETLSFFFDGVPDPNAPLQGRKGLVAVNLKASPTYSVHQPFKEDQCAACHTESFEITGQDSGLCIKCHEPVTRQHPRMHGPVAVGACLWCHLPHESAEAHLFKGPSRQVCTQCHEPGLLSSDRIPEHADLAKGCLECHFAHGSGAPFFLRPSAGGPPIEAPAPPPAEPALPDGPPPDGPPPGGTGAPG